MAIDKKRCQAALFWTLILYYEISPYLLSLPTCHSDLEPWVKQAGFATRCHRDKRINSPLWIRQSPTLRAGIRHVAAVDINQHLSTSLGRSTSSLREVVQPGYPSCTPAAGKSLSYLRTGILPSISVQGAAPMYAVHLALLSSSGGTKGARLVQLATHQRTRRSPSCHSPPILSYTAPRYLGIPRVCNLALHASLYYSNGEYSDTIPTQKSSKNLPYQAQLEQDSATSHFPEDPATPAPQVPPPGLYRPDCRCANLSELAPRVKT
ncbi:hypothetical protein EV426DRAFT_575250 [Tirmania nivea]|nr:hypothetical protein EV426DRAFT_575250 [Tirmania nivea]